MEFNKKKCFALLKERKKLQQEGKSFRDFDKAKNKELMGYLTLLDDQIFWQNRKEYYQILDLFVSKKITLDELFKQFYDLRSSNLKESKTWKENLTAEACGILTKSNEIDFQLNPQSPGFSEIIYSLFEYINLCDPDITFDMNLKHPELIWYGISEETLRGIIKAKFLPQIDDYCKNY